MTKEEIIRAIASELRAERAVRRLTLDELAGASGIPKSSVVRYLDGSRDVPGSALVMLCAGLGLEPEELMARVSRRLGSDKRLLKEERLKQAERRLMKEHVRKMIIERDWHDT